MERIVKILLGLTLSLFMLNGCNQAKEVELPDDTSMEDAETLTVDRVLPTEISERTNTQGWQIYQNDEYMVSLQYPSNWIVTSEGYQSVILMPLEEVDWKPSAPADISKNPAIRIDFGELIREKIGPRYFPETVNVDILKLWLEQKVSNGEASGFSERLINEFQAFEIVELRASDCVKSVFWRPINLQNLVRIETGCESSYLDEFDDIVNNMQQVNK